MLVNILDQHTSSTVFTTIKYNFNVLGYKVFKDDARCSPHSYYGGLYVNGIKEIEECEEKSWQLRVNMFLTCAVGHRSCYVYTTTTFINTCTTTYSPFICTIFHVDYNAGKKVYYLKPSKI